MALYRESNWQDDVRTGSDEIEEQLCHDKAYSVALLASKAARWTPSITSTLEAPTSALDLYLKAIDLERKDQLLEALVYYRRAFRLDPDVDRAYRQYEQEKTAATAATGTAVLPKAINAPHQSVPHSYSSFASPTHHTMNNKDPLDDLVIQFNQQNTQYIPAVDYKPMPIAKVPGEILVQVLQHLALHSVSSVAKFALVCKRFFVATRSPSLWRFVCEHAFREPGMSMEESKRVQAEMVMSLYGGYWLRMYIERPRIRYDGVYISVCQYIRPGVSETAWTQPVHLVTYYRYLRFFPDGTIIKYLSTDEPNSVVRLLTPNFSRRQVFHGRFTIHSNDEIVIEMRDLLARPKERFKMVLRHIKKSRRGRLCKLGWQEYISEKEGREEGTTYDLKLMRPYIFSVVRSYSNAL